jgi:hypothetical protein
MSFLTWLLGLREIKCQHVWEIVGCSYTRSSLKPTRDSELSWDGQKLVFGYTDVYSACTKCGQIKHEDFLGKFCRPGFKFE